MVVGVRVQGAAAFDGNILTLAASDEHGELRISVPGIVWEELRNLCCSHCDEADRSDIVPGDIEVFATEMDRSNLKQPRMIEISIDRAQKLLERYRSLP